MEQVIKLSQTNDWRNFQSCSFLRKKQRAFLPDLSYFTEGRKEEREDILLPLDILSPRQKEIIYLLFYDCLSENEAWKHLGISRRSIKTLGDLAPASLPRNLTLLPTHLALAIDG